MTDAALTERMRMIRAAWAFHEPRILAALREGRRCDPYFLDWWTLFTPIERMVWCDIRYFGVPLYPQYPAGRFILDFADPFNRIAVECDGAAYHDSRRDAVRDDELALAGWRVYRVSGAECCRTIEVDEDDYGSAIRRATLTSEGLIEALAVAQYGRRTGMTPDMADDVLSLRLSSGTR